MKITKKILENIIKEEVQAVMTPGGAGGGANDVERKKIVKAALGHIRDLKNPRLSVEDIALHIQYDNFDVMDADEPMRSDQENYIDPGERISADMLRRQILAHLPTKSAIAMAIFGMDNDILQQYVEQIAGNGNTMNENDLTKADDPYEIKGLPRDKVFTADQAIPAIVNELYRIRKRLNALEGKK